LIYPRIDARHPAKPIFYHITTPVSLGAGFLGFVVLITLFVKNQPLSAGEEVPTVVA
jgi:hypothetical protein